MRRTRSWKRAIPWHCRSRPGTRRGGQGATVLAQIAAQRELTTGESGIQFSFRNLDALIRRMSALPGRRIIVLMSPGFFVTPSMHESGDVIDRATKANVVINTIDAR